MKKYSTLLGAAVVGLSATASFATISLQVTTVAINTTLSSNGWVGYQLSLVADGTNSPHITAWDFANNGGGLVGNIGIRGDLHQRWSWPGATPAPTPTSAALPATQNGTQDSFFFTQSNFTIVDNPTEDNNLQNGPNPPYTQSPLTDSGSQSTPGFNYGVGTALTWSGAYTGTPPTTVNLAFIIVPATLPTTIRGVAQDGSANGVFAINTTLPASVVVPEPASLGLLALGGLGLLARRRRA